MKRISLFPIPTNSSSVVTVFKSENRIEKIMIDPTQSNILYFVSKDDVKNNNRYELTRLVLSQFGTRLTSDNIVNYFNLQSQNTHRTKCNCDQIFQNHSIHPNFSLFQDNDENINFVLMTFGENKMYVAKESFCECNEVRNFPVQRGNESRISDIVSNYPLLLIQTSNHQLAWRYLPDFQGLHEKSNDFQWSNVDKVSVFNPARKKLQRASQPRSCLFLTMVQSNSSPMPAFHLINKTSESLTISLPRFRIKENCRSIQPQIIYSASYRLINESERTGPFNISKVIQQSRLIKNVSNFNDKVECLTKEGKTCQEISQSFSVDPKAYEDSLWPSLENLVRRSFTLPHLQPYTHYYIQIRARTPYGSIKIANTLPNQAEDSTKYDPEMVELVARTGEGKPSAPRNISVVVLSPETALVTWLPSLQMNGKTVSYFVKWTLCDSNDNTEFTALVTSIGQIPSSSLNKNNPKGNPNRMHFLIGSSSSNHMQKLLPNRSYKVWIVAKTEFPIGASSETKRFATFERPNLVQIPPEYLKPRSLVLNWISPAQDNISKHEIKLLPKDEFERFTKMGSVQNFIDLKESQKQQPSSIKGLKSLPTNLTQPSQIYSYQIDELTPGTTYVVLVQVTYKSQSDWNSSSSNAELRTIEWNNHNAYQWPKDDRQTVTTPPDTPLTPGPPYDEIDEGVPYLRYHLYFL